MLKNNPVEKKTAFSIIAADSNCSHTSLYKVQDHVDQGTPHKIRYTEIKRRVRNVGRAFSTQAQGEIFLNRIPIAYAL